MVNKLFSSPIVLILAIWYFFLRKPQPTNAGYNIPANTGGVNTISTPTGGGSTALTGSSSTGVTITQAKADSIADQLEEELSGWTDDDEIKRILNPLNQMDFLAVKQSFGLRDPGIGYDEIDLVKWLIEDTSDDTLTWLKQKFPSIF